MSEKMKRFSAGLLAIVFLVSTLGFTGLVIWQMTQDKDQTSQTAEEEQPVDENALAGKPLKGFDTVKSVDKLTIIDLKEGSGATAKKGDNITANYTGALAKTGIVFESSLDRGEPATFGLDQVILGWQDGVPGMKEGGKRRLLIPASQAYGEQASADIPANSPLVFDIELIKIN